MRNEIPLRTCRACWTGVSCHQFRPRSNFTCDGCMTHRRKVTAAEGMRRIARRTNEKDRP